MKIIKYISALSLFLVAGAILYFEPFRASVQSQEIPVCPQPKYVDDKELWSLVVAYKKQNNLQEPTIDQNLCKISQMRLATLKDNWSHEDFYGDWKYQITHLNTLAENLAKDQTSARQVLDEWIASELHKQNLLKNYPNACIECAYIDTTNYCVYITGMY